MDLVNFLEILLDKFTFVSKRLSYTEKRAMFVDFVRIFVHSHTLIFIKKYFSTTKRIVTIDLPNENLEKYKKKIFKL